MVRILAEFRTEGMFFIDNSGIIDRHHHLASCEIPSHEYAEALNRAPQFLHDSRPHSSLQTVH